jgi:hypothetical protein
VNRVNHLETSKSFGACDFRGANGPKAPGLRSTRENAVGTKSSAEPPQPLPNPTPGARQRPDIAEGLIGEVGILSLRSGAARLDRPVRPVTGYLALRPGTNVSKMERPFRFGYPLTEADEDPLEAAKS